MDVGDEAILWRPATWFVKSKFERVRKPPGAHTGQLSLIMLPIIKVTPILMVLMVAGSESFVPLRDVAMQ